ncbi:MAG: hypothetical protein ACQEWV_13020 [Bacillota bacterium]
MFAGSMRHNLGTTFLSTKKNLHTFEYIFIAMIVELLITGFMAVLYVNTEVWAINIQYMYFV